MPRLGPKEYTTLGRQYCITRLDPCAKETTGQQMPLKVLYMVQERTAAIVARMYPEETFSTPSQNLPQDIALKEGTKFAAIIRVI